MTDGQLRASDAEREQTVESLRKHLLDGRLTLEEFTERVGSALTARTVGDLATVEADLPAVVHVAPARSSRRPPRVVAAAFAHVVRRGRFRLPRRSTAIAAMADLDLDVREAWLEHPDTVVTAWAVLGNVDVYVPDGVAVEVTGLTVFGHRRQWGTSAAPGAGPTIRVRALGLFATVDVWCVPPDLRGDYGDITRALEQDAT